MTHPPVTLEISNIKMKIENAAINSMFVVVPGISDACRLYILYCEREYSNDDGWMVQERKVT